MAYNNKLITNIFNLAYDFKQRTSDAVELVLKQKASTEIVIEKTKYRTFGFKEDTIQVSDIILEEMIKRGDSEAKHIKEIGSIRTFNPDHPIDPPKYTYANVLRTNAILMEIIREGKLNNTVSTLYVYQVPLDSSLYQIIVCGKKEEIIGIAKQLTFDSKFE